jgi:ankyrin repeat protein
MAQEEAVPVFETPAEYLFYAVRTKRLSIINSFVKTGEVDVASLDGQGQTALHLAAQVGSVDVVRALLRAGCPVDLRCQTGPYSGKTAFEICSHRPELKHVRVIPNFATRKKILCFFFFFFAQCCCFPH